MEDQQPEQKQQQQIEDDEDDEQIIERPLDPDHDSDVNYDSDNEPYEEDDLSDFDPYKGQERVKQEDKPFAVFDVDPKAQFKVLSNDKEPVKITIPASVICRSQYLQDLYSQGLDEGEEQQEDDLPVLEEAPSKSLNYIIEYCNHYYNPNGGDKEKGEEHKYALDIIQVSVPIVHHEIRDIVLDKWEAEFIDRICGRIPDAAKDKKRDEEYTSMGDVIDLMNTCDYLQIECLLQLCSAKVASCMCNRTPEFQRRVFELVNDYTEEEYKKVCEDNKWAEEACRLDFDEQ